MSDDPRFNPDFLARRAADMAASYGCTLVEATNAIEAMVGLVRLQIENANLKAGRCPNCDHLSAEHDRAGCKVTVACGPMNIDSVFRQECPCRVRDGR